MICFLVHLADADIDECRRPDAHNCSAESSTCRNIIGGFECVCKDGYMAVDAFTCTGKLMYYVHAVVFQKIYILWIIALCVYIIHSTLMQNISMCLGQQDRCTYIHSCISLSLCLFVDINECSLGLHTCNPKTMVCQNTVGSYECPCKRGYRMEAGSQRCTGETAFNINKHACTTPPKDMLLIPLLYCPPNASGVAACLSV